jgi:hypothetical protein
MGRGHLQVPHSQRSPDFLRRTESLLCIGLIAPPIKALQQLKVDNEKPRGEVEELRNELREMKGGVG